MVADGREDRHVGEGVFDHLHAIPDDLQVAFQGRVPDVVRHQVTSPDDEVQVLHGRRMDALTDGLTD